MVRNDSSDVVDTAIVEFVLVAVTNQGGIVIVWFSSVLLTVGFIALVDIGLEIKLVSEVVL